MKLTKSRAGVSIILLLALALALTLIVGTPSMRANAGVGDCATNTSNYFSSICTYRDTQFSGAYAEWPSVGLNITQTAANNREFIAQHMLLWDRWHTPTSATMLEVGDTAGGGSIPGHAGEWARMWYWAQVAPTYSENFIAYSPADGLNRSCGMQWESSESAWVVYIAGLPKAWVRNWRDPSTTADMQQITGLEIYNGGRVLDASKNSGLFTNGRQLWRDLSNQWYGWDLRWQQVDSPCGTAPTCLQGWWNGFWNNAKPAS